MIKKICLIFVIIFIILFFYCVVDYYISDINVKKINKNRSNINFLITKQSDVLIFLENDTSDVIEFNYGYSVIDKKPKRKFWELFNQ
tara:strand:+ start:1203 stop:1463 length:261 start_codon:yes stop_codon:yes gene_type:complete